MKPLFLDCPPAWTRTKSLDQTPADYASAIERVGGTGYSPSWWVAMALITAVATVVIVWTA